MRENANRAKASFQIPNVTAALKMQLLRAGPSQVPGPQPTSGAYRDTGAADENHLGAWGFCFPEFATPPGCGGGPLRRLFGGGPLHKVMHPLLAPPCESRVNIQPTLHTGHPPPADSSVKGPGGTVFKCLC